MSNITLFSASDTGVTVINNRFVDEYMPHANGSFVKVYLLLLRCLQNNRTELTISILAELLEETEKDIDRALRYWEKENLLSLIRSDLNTITGIMFTFPETVNSASLPKETASKTIPVTDTVPPTPTTSTMPSVSPAKTVIHKPDYSEAQIKQLTDMEEVKWIMNTVERVLERMLKPNDIQLILFLYESVGFSPDLIFYLYEYCASKNKKTASYIETVAISWAEDGIDTVEKAEEATLAYNNNYNAVNKAFGLNRAPGTIEKKYMHRWFHEFGFDIPIIEEACNRTILAVGKPDFKYADKILETWKKKNVISLSDIKALDEVHARQSAATAQNRQPASPAKPAAPNKFNAFPQRKYSEEDFLTMEQRLLNNRS